MNEASCCFWWIRFSKKAPFARINCFRDMWIHLSHHSPKVSFSYFFLETYKKFIHSSFFKRFFFLNDAPNNTFSLCLSWLQLDSWSEFWKYFYDKWYCCADCKRTSFASFMKTGKAFFVCKLQVTRDVSRAITREVESSPPLYLNSMKMKAEKN